MRVILFGPLKTFQIIEMSVSDDRLAELGCLRVVGTFHIYRGRLLSI